MMRRFFATLLAAAVVVGTWGNWSAVGFAQTDDGGLLRLTKGVATELENSGTLSNVHVFEVAPGGRATTDDLIAANQATFDGASRKLTIKQPGIYSVEYSTTPDGQPIRILVRVVNPAPVASTFGGAQPEPATPAAIRKELNFEPGSEAFKSMVLQLASNWGTVSGDKNHKDYVARFDLTPADTCSKIANILREAAKGLESAAPDVVAVESKMKQNFEFFYKSGESEYRLKNPYVDDWKPFLQRLEKEARSKIPQGKEKDPKFLQLMLLELADGFSQLGDEFRGVTTRATAQGTTGQSMGSDSGYRGRRRCRCSSLLWLR
ncbi:MAG: hypothetical protein ACKV0T_04875 [Planctomycetales bacterium]